MVGQSITGRGRSTRHRRLFLLSPAVLLCLLFLPLTLAGCDSLQATGASTPKTTGALSVASMLAAKPPAETPPPATLTPSGAPSLSAAAAILLDPTTGHVYYALHADDERPMASTTKIMTAVVALTYGSLDQQIKVQQDAVVMNNGQDSVAGLQLGDRLTLKELLYCLLLPSGDDAAVAIAHGVAGSQAAFVRLMNTEAFLLGLTHTHYSDPTGLDAAGHYTSARDLAKLAAYAMRFPAFAQIVATPSITLPASGTHQAYPLTNTNLLLPGLSDAYPGITGIKTGYTGGAGDCLVFAARRSGKQLLGVVLGEPSESARFVDATALLDWGFRQEQG